MWSVCAPPRLKARRVGSPRTTSRKYAESPTSACQLARDRALADRPIRAMNTGTTGSVTTMIRADFRSTTAVQNRTATGTVTARTTCGRYWAK
jgi:hypothetical protein